MRVPWALGLAMALGGLVLVSGTRPACWAASRPGFTDLRVHERLHELDPQVPGDMDASYLYGTLSLLERRAGPYRIDISGVEHDHLLPLAVFDIYHEIPTYIQSEFSDYTVWGVLDDVIFHDAILAMAETEHAATRRKSPPSREAQSRRSQLGLGLGVNLLGRYDNLHFDLRSDYTFEFSEMARMHGEQRQFYAEADFYAGRGGVDYHKRGIIAQTLQRILQIAHALMDNKVLAVGLFGMVLLVVKVTQGIMSRP